MARLLPDRRGVLAVYAVAFIGFLYLPILFLPLFSVNDATIVAFPLSGFTWKWYQGMAANPVLHQAVWASLQVALATSVIATILGVCGARALTRYRWRGQKAMQGLILLPLVMPDIIIAIGLLVLLLGLGFELSLLTVTLGHVLFCIPFSVAVLMSSFEGFDRSLEEASQDLGEGAMMTFLRVTLPIVSPGLVASALICFTISLDEFIVAFFLSGNTPTLPVYIWSQLRFPSGLPAVLALGTVLLVSSFVLLGLAEWARGRARARTGAGGVL